MDMRPKSTAGGGCAVEAGGDGFTLCDHAALAFRREPITIAVDASVLMDSGIMDALLEFDLSRQIHDACQFVR